MLHISEEERTPCEGELKQPQKVFIKAVRVMKRSNSMSLEDNGKSVIAKSEVDGLHAYFTPKKNAAVVKMESPKEEVKDDCQEKVITRGTTQTHLTDIHTRRKFRVGRASHCGSAAIMRRSTLRYVPCSIMRT